MMCSQIFSRFKADVIIVRIWYLLIHGHNRSNLLYFLRSHSIHHGCRIPLVHIWTHIMDALTNIFTNLQAVFEVLLAGEYVFARNWLTNNKSLRSPSIRNGFLSPLAPKWTCRNLMFTNIFTNLRAVFEVLLAANIYSPCENSCLCNCIGVVKQL